ncbi:NAD-dependent epimerase/dehydratase family protein [Epilithonimonas hominis]|uniref:NAD-dependent epimerase/dehydratase family protein n=1 Tax=Epilithonimonas hominis TaxID=420404 RepID=UPI0028A028E6|nr:NAD-dependent epimerase/dehydratase family protein [Epilithonimonas hominis]
MRILVTGAAGFIGYHLCQDLLKKGHTVVGVDNLNHYYDVTLKYARLKNLGIDADDNLEINKIIRSEGNLFTFYKSDITDKEFISELFREQKFDIVCNLAAQAGVRYSLENPFEYINSNILGFTVILECCRHYNVDKLVYASSSSVYGQNSEIPYNIDQKVDSPVSLYAASKTSNELMAYTYSHLFGIKTIGLRFFTVYGPWGRPDMAIFLFTNAILKEENLKVFNHGKLSRDFTYIDDIVEGVQRVVLDEPKQNKDLHQIYNIGNSKPVQLMEFIQAIEVKTQKTAKKLMMPMQPGDVYETWADITSLEDNFNYRPTTTVEKGIDNYVDWFKSYYKIAQ